MAITEQTSPAGRHIIGPDTEILGGAFQGRTLIVVDYAENPAPYDALHELVEEDLGQNFGSPLALVRSLHQIVSYHYPYDEEKMFALLKTQADELGLTKLPVDHEIMLSRSMEEKGIICQEEALIKGAVGRLVQMKHNLPGQMSVEPGKGPKDHAFFRYQTEAGVYVSDSTGGLIVGSLVQGGFIGKVEPRDPYSQAYLRKEERPSLVRPIKDGLSKLKGAISGS